MLIVVFVMRNLKLELLNRNYHAGVFTKNEKEIGLIESKKGCPICRGEINIEGTSP
uniref:Uncharacterized protein n=1 Tax=Meloidogyne enterolobii TaxID=390850 RepID=A0A6V7VAC3_MELEN|nr:unnamed protein product [Meloidogyne enterolobii]